MCKIWQHLAASIHTAGTKSVCGLPPSLVMLRFCIFHGCIQYFLPQSLYITLYYNGDMAVNKHQSSHAGLFVPFSYKYGGADFSHLHSSNINKLLLLLQYRYDVLWEALLQPHLDRPESSAHFSAAVLFCSFQVSPPTPEDQQSALQLPQVVSVPWREGTAIATLQVTKITHLLNPYKHTW